MTNLPKGQIPNHIRWNLKSGDLLLCSGNYPFSQLIRQATKSNWSHVGVVYYIKDFSDWFVAEAIETLGVRLIPLSKYVYDYRDNAPYSGQVFLGRFNLPENFDFDRSLRFIGSKLGKKYDAKENLKIAWEIFSGTGSKERTDDIYNCAEFVSQQYRQGGFKIKSGYPTNTPKAISEDPSLTILSQLI